MGIVLWFNFSFHICMRRWSGARVKAHTNDLTMGSTGRRDESRLCRCQIHSHLRSPANNEHNSDFVFSSRNHFYYTHNPWGIGKYSSNKLIRIYHPETREKHAVLLMWNGIWQRDPWTLQDSDTGITREPAWRMQTPYIESQNTNCLLPPPVRTVREKLSISQLLTVRGSLMKL